jgi:amidohydrolase
MSDHAVPIEPSVKGAVEKYRETARVLCEELYRSPETSTKEYESSRKIVALLREGGFIVEFPFCGYETAFKAELVNGDGPAVAFMVEYDALPGVGHGCGHNLHGALSVLAGLACLELRECFTGTVYVIGTPAEETEGAKARMAEQGAFDGLALAVMMHSIGGGICQSDMDALSLRNYMLRFTGKPAHAVAAPWEGRSALAAARKFIDLIDARRECFTPDIHFNAIFTDGGTAMNIIPEHAAVNAEFRTASMAGLEKLDETVRKCAQAAAMALDCEVSWEQLGNVFADMIRVKALEDEVEGIFRGLSLAVAPVSPPLGSTDVGNVSYRCPTVQPLIAITADHYALHTREFAASTIQAPAFHAMELGAQILVTLALKILTNESFRSTVQAEFEKCRDERLKKR